MRIKKWFFWGEVNWKDTLLTFHVKEKRLTDVTSDLPLYIWCIGMIDPFSYPNGWRTGIRGERCAFYPHVWWVDKDGLIDRQHALTRSMWTGKASHSQVSWSRRLINIISQGHQWYPWVRQTYSYIQVVTGVNLAISITLQGSFFPVCSHMSVNRDKPHSFILLKY